LLTLCVFENAANITWACVTMCHDVRWQPWYDLVWARCWKDGRKSWGNKGMYYDYI